MEETPKQKKVAALLQEDLVQVLQNAATSGGLKGVIISVTKVNVTADLSIAKVYLSIFPTKEAERLLKGILTNTQLIRYELAQRTRHQLRRMPRLQFFIDDSLDYIDKIERSLKEKENPIKNSTLLDKRKKS